MNITGRLYKDSVYICEVLEIPTTGFTEEVFSGVPRLHSYFITDKDIGYGMGQSNYHVYLKGLGFVPVEVQKVTPLSGGIFRCDYLAYLKPRA